MAAATSVRTCGRSRRRLAPPSEANGTPVVALRSSSSGRSRAVTCPHRACASGPAQPQCSAGACIGVEAASKPVGTAGSIRIGLPALAAGMPQNLPQPTAHPKMLLAGVCIAPACLLLPAPHPAPHPTEPPSTPLAPTFCASFLRSSSSRCRSSSASRRWLARKMRPQKMSGGVAAAAAAMAISGRSCGAKVSAPAAAAEAAAGEASSQPPASAAAAASPAPAAALSTSSMFRQAGRRSASAACAVPPRILRFVRLRLALVVAGQLGRTVRAAGPHDRGAVSSEDMAITAQEVCFC